MKKPDYEIINAELDRISNEDKQELLNYEQRELKEGKASAYKGGGKDEGDGGETGGREESEEEESRQAFGGDNFPKEYEFKEEQGLL